MAVSGEVLKSATAGGRLRRNALIATAVGSFLEWYDFFVYGTFATVIAVVFFPGGDPVASLLATFAVFGVAFVARPLGAIAFGHFGDRFGRKNTFAASILVMVIATLAIGIAPSYASVGIWATVWLTVARLAQGFSTGGEFGGATSYMLEIAPSHRRGVYACLQAFTVGLGVMAGTGVGALLTNVLSRAEVESWGWRIPFLLAVPLGVVGLFVRRRLVETPAFEQVSREAPARPPLVDTVVNHWRQVLQTLGIVLAWTITAYVFVVYIPTYLQTAAELGLGASLAITMAGVAVWVGSVPVMAALSDRWGRRPVLAAGSGGVLVWSWPAFALLGSGSAGAALLGLLPMMVALGACSGPAGATLAELFPARVRYTAVGLGFALCSAVFGGTAPFLATWWVSELGAQWLLIVYTMLAGAITLVVVATIPETRPRSLPE